MVTKMTVVAWRPILSALSYLLSISSEPQHIQHILLVSLFSPCLVRFPCAVFFFFVWFPFILAVVLFGALALGSECSWDARWGTRRRISPSRTRVES